VTMKTECKHVPGRSCSLSSRFVRFLVMFVALGGKQIPLKAQSESVEESRLAFDRIQYHMIWRSYWLKDIPWLHTALQKGSDAVLFRTTLISSTRTGLCIESVGRCIGFSEVESSLAFTEAKIVDRDLDVAARAFVNERSEIGRNYGEGIQVSAAFHFWRVRIRGREVEDLTTPPVAPGSESSVEQLAQVAERLRCASSPDSPFESRESEFIAPKVGRFDPVWFVVRLCTPGSESGEMTALALRREGSGWRPTIGGLLSLESEPVSRLRLLLKERPEALLRIKVAGAL